MIRQIAKSIREYRRPAILTPFLMVGEVGASNAFAISKRLGLEEDLIEDAKEYLA